MSDDLLRLTEIHQVDRWPFRANRGSSYVGRPSRAGRMLLHADRGLSQAKGGPFQTDRGLKWTDVRRRSETEPFHLNFLDRQRPFQTQRDTFYVNRGPSLDKGASIQSNYDHIRPKECPLCPAWALSEVLRTFQTAEGSSNEKRAI